MTEAFHEDALIIQVARENMCAALAATPRGAVEAAMQMLGLPKDARRAKSLALQMVSEAVQQSALIVSQYRAHPR